MFIHKNRTRVNMSKHDADVLPEHILWFVPIQIKECLGPFQRSLLEAALEWAGLITAGWAAGALAPRAKVRLVLPARKTARCRVREIASALEVTALQALCVQLQRTHGRSTMQANWPPRASSRGLFVAAGLKQTSSANRIEANPAGSSPNFRHHAERL